MAAPSKPPSKRQRRAKAKAAQLEAELESSSSSGEDSAPEAAVREISMPISRTQPQETIVIGSSSDSESSALLSSSDEDDEPQQRRKAKGKQRADPAIEPAAAVETPAPVAIPQRPPLRQRSPSPPYIGFSSAPRTGKPILWGHVPGDGTKPTSEDPQYAAFRQVYLSSIVESFGSEIAGVQKDVSSQDRLDRLIAALADGADVFGKGSDRDAAVEATARHASENDDAMET